MKQDHLPLPAAARTFWAAVIWALLAVLLPWADGGRDEWQQPERVVADLSIRPGVTVADVGCGDGYFTFRLAKAAGDTGKVLAVDIDDSAIKTIETRANKEKAANVKAIRSEPTDTKLEGSSVDVALLCDVIHHVPEAERLPLVRDIVRALKPGGYLFLVDWRKSREVTFDPYERLIPREDLVKLARDAGLTLDAEFYYLKYQVFLRLRKPPTP